MSLKTWMKIKWSKTTILIRAEWRTDLDLPEKEIQERDKESKVITKLKESLEEVQDLQGA